MSEIRDWNRFIDRLLRNYQNAAHYRSESTQDNLRKVLIRMKRYQKELLIPDRAIMIVDYFARNNNALIIPDANVRHAFLHARRAMNM